ncbi:hypothetical protein Bbelb_329680 [Branchiostoma belcheri]|nr:hypothetical protein Bbelb_329680 [Branchiostoma belcheri]
MAFSTKDRAGVFSCVWMAFSTKDRAGVFSCVWMAFSSKDRISVFAVCGWCSAPRTVCVFLCMDGVQHQGQGMCVDDVQHQGQIEVAPCPIWVLKPAEKTTADNRLVSIRVPIGFGWSPKRLFFAAGGIISILCMGCWGKTSGRQLFKLCDVIGALTHSIVRPEMVPRVQAALDECLCLVGRYLPSHVMVMVLYQLTHLPEYLARYGPLSKFCQAMNLSQHLPDGAIPTTLAISTLRGPQPTETVNSCILLTEKKRKPESCELSEQQREDLAKHLTKKADWKSPTPKVLETRQNTVSQVAGDTAGAIQSGCKAVEEKLWEHSSFVAKDWKGYGPCFGRIQFFGRHRFLGVDSDFACEPGDQTEWEEEQDFYWQSLVKEDGEV